ncbi:restriction endonuclease subunit S [Pseudomonas aeruginosa]|uniref:restriction endonuclease subunit S n=2 Tax=Pseudomonas aeruginosa TaxID=287 RepID=UPI0009A391E7|nr:restriction endonuclease subunit S [Pseudomonas aeruginosa]MCO2505831.1 restriction endonuclease subunit S [Pseudomonas aeruginosa]MDP5441338.1 restriction endonuclease subunit S [Pseudomonas aeruginosa]MDP5667643.1 restriction endonuclease subunit S [Pseudomonas aeruginosa]
MSGNEKKLLVPRLRFPEYRAEDGWGSEFGNMIFDQISNKDHNSDLPVLAITQEQGAIPREMIDYHVSVTDKSLESYKVVEVGDFIISLRSFQGGIEFSRYRGICSPAYVILRLRHGHSEDYFRHYLKTDRFIAQMIKNLEGLRDGKMISYKQFSELELPIPPRDEQQKIADCLSSLDDLIAAETYKLDTLKTHKKGLMQQLFPREGETVPGLRFPEFREAGEWKETLFGKLVVKSFYGTSSSTSNTGKYPVLRMGNMVDGALSFSNLAYIDLDEKSFAKIRLAPGDILLNRTNSPDLVGKVSIFDQDIECITASYIVTYRLDRAQVVPEFCNLILNTPRCQRKIRALARPSISQANINPTAFKNELTVALPNIEEQRRIVSCFSDIDERISSQIKKIELLKVQKAGLMQQLFPVPDGAVA